MEAVHALGKVHAEMHRLLASVADQGISAAELLVLHQLVHVEGVTAGQVMAATGLTSGGVTGLIDRLEARGLVVRRRSKQDRRVVIVELASDAMSRMAPLMQAAHQEAALLFEGWSLNRIRSLVRLLKDVPRPARASA